MTLRAVAPSVGGGGDTGVQSVTGSVVDNTDPQNPVIVSDPTKVDTLTGTAFVYAVNSGGTQTAMPYSNGIMGSSIAQRTSSGQLRTQDPVTDTDTVNLRYLNNMPAITSAGGNLTIPAGTLASQLQALADAIDPAP